MKPTPRELLEAAARTKIPEDVNLWPHMAARLERKSFFHTLRTKPVLLGLSILFSLAMLTGVAYAIGRSLGYIRGVGFVENNQTVRVLSRTIEISNDGVALHVDSLTADSQQTRISYRIINFPLDLAGEYSASPGLELPDGVQLKSTTTKASIMGSSNGLYTLEMRVIFPVVPTGVNEVSFLAPSHFPPVRLQLIPAPQGMVLPATEIPGTFETSHPVLPTPTRNALTTPFQNPAGSQPATTPGSQVSGLSLDKVTEVNDTYLLQGSFTDAGDLPGTVIRLNEIPFDMRVTDRNGNYVPAWIRPELIPSATQSNTGYWAFEIPKAVQTPVTLTLSHVTLFNEASFHFPLDTGTAPATGQTWAINQIIKSGKYSFLVESISRNASGYAVKFHALAPITQENLSSILNIEGYTILSFTENVGKENGNLEWTEGLVFKGNVPDGNVNFSLEIFTTDQAGPWTLTWSPANP
jgi:hypothetical protein